MRIFNRYFFRSPTRIVLVILLLFSIILTVIFYNKLVTYPHDSSTSGHFHKIVTYNLKSGDFMSKYCNTVGTLRQESLLPISVIKEHQLSLVGVAVLARHGDRAPLRPVKKWRKINYKGSPSVQSTLSQKFKISASQKAHMPGPYESMVASEHPTLGQLSWLGALQHLELGNLLNSAYKDHLELKSFSAITTPYERTYQSAAALLFGLIEPLVSAPVAVTMIRNRLKMAKSPFLCFEHCNQCPRMQSLQETLESKRNASVTSHPAVASLMNKLIATVATTQDSDLPMVTNGSFDQVKGFSSPEAILDGIAAYVCHEESLPCASDGPCASFDDVGHLLAFIVSFYKSSSLDDSFYLRSLLKIRGLLARLSKILSTGTGFNLLMAHDITLFPVMNVLGFMDGSIPGYADRISFQAYSTAQGKRLLRILYNGQDVTKNSLLCDRDSCQKLLSNEDESVFTLAPVEKVENFVVRKLVQLANTDSYEEACNVAQ